MKTTLTKKAFMSYCADEVRALIAPVKAQSGCDTWQEFADYMDNVCASPYGAAAGFTGFIYYSETVGFWRANRSKITALLNSEAEACGEDNTLSLIQGFNGLKDYDADELARALYGRFNDDLTQIYNVFAWFALETVAYNWERFKEDNE